MKGSTTTTTTAQIKTERKRYYSV